ncbi:MarR family transcriptional regulator [Eubacterium sp. AM05-23]|uniref:MarR family winged helix-turn-helix transcriptional regulator n=1 Tax=Eubacterium TaxID=1730 RepID=UPI000E466CDF|nr:MULTISPECIES: MarR family transcriptional regulator [Eubacterium]MBS6341193.1 MarR family transcriptional regulator [Eubacterium limosum]RHO60641.1 MarR family transcriptional regulator [Eubacterium sp. AM05-23]
MNELNEKLMEQFRKYQVLMHQGMRRFAPRGPKEDPHHGQGKVLVMLAENDGVSQKLLTEQSGIRPASLSELIIKLERNGLVERHRNEEDKRNRNVYLTEDGRALAETIKSRKDESADFLFDVLSEEEKETLTVLFDKLITSLEDKVADMDEEMPPLAPPHPHLPHGGPHGPHHEHFGGPHGPHHGPGPHDPEHPQPPRHPEAEEEDKIVLDVLNEEQEEE